MCYTAPATAAPLLLLLCCCCVVFPPRTPPGSPAPTVVPGVASGVYDVLLLLLLPLSYRCSSVPAVYELLLLCCCAVAAAAMYVCDMSLLLTLVGMVIMSVNPSRQCTFQNRKTDPSPSEAVRVSSCYRHLSSISEEVLCLRSFRVIRSSPLCCCCCCRACCTNVVAGASYCRVTRSTAALRTVFVSYLYTKCTLRTPSVSYASCSADYYVRNELFMRCRA